MTDRHESRSRHRSATTSRSDGLPPAEGAYLGWASTEGFVEDFEARHPRLADTLWFGDPRSAMVLEGLREWSNEFDTDDDGGRGDSYRIAQRTRDARLTGIRALLELVTGTTDLDTVTPDTRVLDVLGGDGLLAQAVELVAPSLQVQPILTADVSERMVLAALARGLPAVRQPAHHMFQRAGSLDGVLVAYGTHHVDPALRGAVGLEAHRVLRPGGRLVVHDFEQGSPMDRWFGEVVHRHSEAGHDYRHFERAELRAVLEEAGFEDVRVRSLYDPIRVHGVGEEAALATLLGYLINMYGLTGVAVRGSRGLDELHRWLVENMLYERGPDGVETQHCTGLSILLDGAGDGGAVAELPRFALVADGTKPAG